MTELIPQRETRERVLEAAGELFAEKGFRDTTIREIKDRAGANIAAVNYYFRDKDTLHREVLRRAFQYARDHLVDATLSHDTPAAERLGLFIRAFVEALLGSARPAWHTHLIMREFCDPTQAFREVAMEYGRPNMQRLEDILVELLPSTVDPRHRQMAVMSVFGQCLYYRASKSVALEMMGLSEYSPEIIAEISKFITLFTLAAIRGCVANSPAEGG